MAADHPFGRYVEFVSKPARSERGRGNDYHHDLGGAEALRDFGGECVADIDLLLVQPGFVTLGDKSLLESTNPHLVYRRM